MDQDSGNGKEPSRVGGGIVGPDQIAHDHTTDRAEAVGSREAVGTGVA